MADALVDLVSSVEAGAYLAAMGQTAPANLDAIITGVSLAMQEYASRRFVSQSYTAVLDGQGGARLSLPNFPITAVSAFSVDGVAWAAATSPTSRGFVFSETQVGLRGGIICRGFQNVSITYTAGFAAVPADLKLACNEGIAAIVASFDYSDPRAIEVKAGGSSIKLGSMAEIARLCLTANVTAILDQRKRVHPA